MNYLILVLATWRISAMLSYEDGPRLVFRKLREFLGFEYDDDGELAVEPLNFWGGLIGCMWCLSVWIAIIFWISYLLWPDVIYPLAPFALSTGVIIIERIVNG